jgi:hypothetical protein
MRQVRIQGCLPALLVLVLLGALAVLAVTAGLAVVAVTAGGLVVLGVVRGVRRLMGLERRPTVAAPGAEPVPPGWLDEGGGPVVEAGPKDGPGGSSPDAPDRSSERTLPPGE